MPRSRDRRKSRPASIISTSSFCFSSAMNGRNASRPGWPLNRSSGRVLEVATTTTPRSNSASNSRPRIMRVGDVVHLELVEAQQRGLGGDAVGQRRDRIAPLDPRSGLRRLAAARRGRARAPSA